MALNETELRMKRAELSKRIIAICPGCKSPIRGEHLLKNRAFMNKFLHAKNFPMDVQMPCPGHDDKIIKLYIDANLSVRDYEILSMDKK